MKELGKKRFSNRGAVNFPTIILIQVRANKGFHGAKS